MSEEQLKAFLDAVKADAALQEKLKAVTDADAVVEIAKAAGFMISADDLITITKPNAEISDEELEGVAGGLNAPSAWGECYCRNILITDMSVCVGTNNPVV